MKKVLFVLLSIIFISIFITGCYTPKITINLENQGQVVLLYSSNFNFNYSSEELGSYTIDNPHTEMVEVVGEYSGGVITDVRLNDFHLKIEVTNVDLKDVENVDIVLYLSQNGYSSQPYNLIKSVTLNNGVNSYGIWASESGILADLLNFINSNNTSLTLYATMENNYSGTMIPTGKIDIYLDEIVIQAKIGG